jgi:DNA-binding LacI/PurR family transcriptional regulator
VDEFGWNRPEIILSDHPAQAPLPPAHDIAAFVYVGGYAQGWIDRYSEHRAIPLFMLNPADVLDARTAARIRGTQLCTDNVSAGLKVATLLARYEHRHIAYLENLQAPEMKSWGAPRRDGLAMVFGKAGRSMQSVHIEKSRHKPENVSRMQVKSLAAHINRELKRDAALPPFLRLDALSELWPLIDIIDQRDAYGESFSRLLEDTRISCWVCANDNLAAAAALFLRKHNQRRRVSLVSFDNSTLAYRLRLASYDFRFDLSARAMLWLLAKKAVTPRDQRGIATVTFSHGQLIVRDSLTRAARRTA